MTISQVIAMLQQKLRDHGDRNIVNVNGVMEDERDQLRAKLAAVEQGRIDDVHGLTSRFTDDITHLKQQLAARDARIAELGAHVKNCEIILETQGEQAALAVKQYAQRLSRARQALEAIACHQIEINYLNESYDIAQQALREMGEAGNTTVDIPVPWSNVGDVAQVNVVTPKEEA